MAVVQPKIELLGDRTVRCTWANLANGDTGAPFSWGVYADRSVQVKGTFGVGGSVSLEGSNDETTFNALSDLRGGNLAITSAKLEQIEDCSCQVRPNVTAGDGSTSLTVVLFARKVM